MNKENSKQPVDIKLHRKSATLELIYPNGKIYQLGAEFLRVNSPSAEVRGHGKGQETLQSGKRHVKLSGIEAVGNYAIKLDFDDGHNSGIYSWDYLVELCNNQESIWDDYLNKLAAADESRDELPADTQAITIKPLGK